MNRDFTYIDDIVTGVLRISDIIPTPSTVLSNNSNVLQPDTSTAPFSLYNIGNNQPVKLLDMVRKIEEETGKTAKLEWLPMQAGDVHETRADCEDLFKVTGYRPNTSFTTGIRQFIDWYRLFYC